MTNPILESVDGPDKPALQWAVAYPDRGVTVHFSTEDEVVDAQIEEMSELEDGLSFNLRGFVKSGAYSGQPFSATFSVATRSGAIEIQR
jgi:hypothetical protein